MSRWNYGRPWYKIVWGVRGYRLQDDVSYFPNWLWQRKPFDKSIGYGQTQRSSSWEPRGKIAGKLGDIERD